MPELEPGADTLPPPETVRVQHKDVRFEEATALMDNELRKECEDELSVIDELGDKDAKQAFVDAYREKHLEKFGEEFVINP